MPLIDLAEAASRGDIIVDEFDAVNAVNIGRLSEVKTARMSSIIAQHAMNLRNASSNINNNNGNANVMATTSQDDSTWNGILVDEVELARAAEHNPHARSRLHLQNNNERIRRGVDVQMRDEEPENARQPDVEDSADENSRVWNSLLVDEIDIKHALQRSASLSANDDRVNNNYRHYLNSNLNYESTSPPRAVVLLDDDSDVDDVEPETTSDADEQDESDADVENNNCGE